MTRKEARNVLLDSAAKAQELTADLEQRAREAGLFLGREEKERIVALALLADQGTFDEVATEEVA